MSSEKMISSCQVSVPCCRLTRNASNIITVDCMALCLSHKCLALIIVCAFKGPKEPTWKGLVTCDV